MSKTISRFRFEPDGFFIDLADDEGKIGIDPESGKIFLDEGEGPDRFHGAVIGVQEFHSLELRQAGADAAGHVFLKFGHQRAHDLGETNDVATAMKWITAANWALRAHPSRPASRPAA